MDEWQTIVQGWDRIIPELVSNANNTDAVILPVNARVIAPEPGGADNEN